MNHFRVIEAAALGDAKKLSMLIGEGASVEACDLKGRTALHLASSEGRLAVVEYLIHNKANVHAKDHSGHEPLHEAALGGHMDVVKLLIKAGAFLTQEFKSEIDLKIRSFAARGEFLKMKELVESGFRYDSADYSGKTALHVSSRSGHLEIVEYLLGKGVDIDAQDNCGQTALMMAEQGQHFAVFDALSRSATGTRARKPHAILSNKHCATRSPALERTASFTVMEAFSRPIAAAMLSGRRPEPFTKGAVSLLCSDICGFTTLSGTMAPDAVARLLHRLFRKFDHLAHLHGVQKVDIVGDAYMAAANFTEDQPHDHAARLARFAIDMLAAARETSLDEDGCDGHGVPLRIGVHCGPVSALLVGPRAVKFTLVGEAAVVAARMESSGLPGRVHCSAAFAAAVEQQAHDVSTRRRSQKIRPFAVCLSASARARSACTANHLLPRPKNHRIPIDCVSRGRPSHVGVG
jgi:class 3 adenylate cyclase